MASAALSFFEVDELGLDAIDNRILELLCVQFSGRPVGLTTLASALAEDPDTVEDVYEPYLMQQGPHDAHAEGPPGHHARMGSIWALRRRASRTDAAADLMKKGSGTCSNATT